jgi:ribonuclease HII
MAGDGMGLIIIGVDEAGYGPMLGPLCVGMAACRVEAWKPGDAAPDLWTLLAPSVCRSLKEWRAAKSVPIPIADSKTLKLANTESDDRRSPTMHLERGVMCFLRQVAEAAMPGDDEALAQSLGTHWPTEGLAAERFGGQPRLLPEAWTAGQLAIASSGLEAALDRAGVKCLSVQCRMIDVARFNAIVNQSGSKGQTTLEAIGQYMRWAWETHASGTDAVSLVCDRLGGRERYAATIAGLLNVDAECVGVIEERPERSRYLVQQGNRKLHVTFAVEGEKQHLPIALASMTAKWVRELAMARFNRYWQYRAEHELEVELKPTAGYTTDARRWLRDAASMLTPADRNQMIRIA